MITHLCPIQINAKTRKAKLHGRDHLVAPVVMLVEGVHNGKYYPPAELAKHVGAWNGIPIPIHHPTDPTGVPVSCNSPENHERSVGTVFNTKWDGGKLRAEAWVDVAKCQKASPQTLAALQKGEPLELSTGLFTDDDPTPGTWNGEKYECSVKNFRPDHLALLPGGKGACSWADGCGVRVNSREEKDMWNKLRGLIANFSSEAERLGAEEGCLDLRVNKQLSFDEIRNKVRDALKAKYAKGYVYISEIYDSSVIYELEKPIAVPPLAPPDLPVGPRSMGLFKADYSVQVDGEAKLGEPREVERVVSYKPVINKKEEDEEDDNPVERARKAREAYVKK